MPARTKGRAKFDVRARPFVWWIDGDRYPRIASLDKKFVIAYSLLTDGGPAVVEVIGQEFPGLNPSEPKPVRLVAPQLVGESTGAGVDRLLRWVFDDSLSRKVGH